MGSCQLALLTEEAKKNTQWRKQYMEWERQRTYDYENGKEAGAQQKAIETATNMLKKEYPVTEISEMTGLPQEQILELKNQITVQA